MRSEECWGSFASEHYNINCIFSISSTAHFCAPKLSTFHFQLFIFEIYFKILLAYYNFCFIITIIVFKKEESF